jgi:hypothetical protein
MRINTHWKPVCRTIIGIDAAQTLHAMIQGIAWRDSCSAIGAKKRYVAMAMHQYGAFFARFDGAKLHNNPRHSMMKAT